MFPMQNQNFNNMNFNPNQFQAFLNMMQMNQNFNPNFPMNFNPNFGNNIGNMQQPFNFNPFEQNVILNGGVMPRPKNAQNLVNNQDLFPNYPPGPRFNILFITGAGLKIMIPAPCNATVHELLSKFMYKVGVSESLIDDKIFFVVNGKMISFNEQSTVENFFRNVAFGANQMVNIIVIDASNVIGA